MMDIHEQEEMLKDSDKEGVVLTEFKDWLMDESTLFVEGTPKELLTIRKCAF
jgi:hypothetical protein